MVAGVGGILVEYLRPESDGPSFTAATVGCECLWGTALAQAWLARQLMDVMIEWTRVEGRPLHQALGFAQTNEMPLKL